MIVLPFVVNDTLVNSFPFMIGDIEGLVYTGTDTEADRFQISILPSAVTKQKIVGTTGDQATSFIGAKRFKGDTVSMSLVELCLLGATHNLIVESAPLVINKSSSSGEVTI
jgi:hypothetical protein